MAVDLRERRRIWLALVIAALAAIAFMGRRLLHAGAPVQNVPDVASVTSLVPVMTQLSGERSLSGALHGVDVPALVRDPFRDIESAPPVVARAPSAPVVRDTTHRERVWVVSAILISESRRAAVINDVLVTVGSELPGGARLSAVENDRVIITDSAGVRRTININSGTH